jgi:hypothetical protein
MVEMSYRSVEMAGVSTGHEQVIARCSTACRRRLTTDNTAIGMLERE